MSTAKTDKAQPRRAGFRGRRVWRFSIRSLLIAFTLLSLWLGVHVRSVKRQQEAITAVREQGGWVYYDYETLDVGLRDPQAKSPVPQWLLSALGPDHFHDVVGVNMLSYQSGSRWMQNQRAPADIPRWLDAFPELDTLTMAGIEVTDDGKLVFISYGSRELENRNRPGGNPEDNVEGLKQAGVNAVFYVSPETAHEWHTWRRSLHQFAPLLFKE